MTVITITRARPYLTTSASDPSASDSGYKVGSIWLNTTATRAFICVDNTDGVAVWVDMGGNFLSFTASVDLTAPACVAVDSSGELVYGNAGAESTSNVIGFIPISISAAGVGLVQFSGKFTFTGESFTSIGSSGFLSTTNGQVSETPPSFASGRVIKPICILLSTTDILISLQSGRSY